jgi:hypothetical protein
MISTPYTNRHVWNRPRGGFSFHSGGER